MLEKHTKGPHHNLTKDVHYSDSPYEKAPNMYQEILRFWFEDTDPAQWWKKDEGFDRMIIDQFSAPPPR